MGRPYIIPRSARIHRYRKDRRPKTIFQTKSLSPQRIGVVGNGCVFSQIVLCWPPSESVPMRTHYDVLGVRSDADDEALIKAYRKAAKAHHPDLNAGDPDAPRRFSQIATAIEILRNPQQRAAYDRLLDRQRQQRRLRRVRIIIVVANAIAAAVLVAVLAGGHAPVGPTPSPSTMASKVENNGVPRRGVMVGEQGLRRTEPAGEANRTGRRRRTAPRA